jgi:hypothetical protein
MGITNEVFKAEEKTPDWSEILKMVVTGNVSEKAQFFRNMGGTPSGPLEESSLSLIKCSHFIIMYE